MQAELSCRNGPKITANSAANANNNNSNNKKQKKNPNANADDAAKVCKLHF